MNIIMQDIGSLQLAEYNPRQIDELSLKQLVESLIAYGFVSPVVRNIRTGRVVGGHQRIKALPIAVRRIQKILKAGGIDDEKRQLLEVRIEAFSANQVPVHDVDISEPEEKALNLALNKISGDWDADKLAAVLASLKDEAIPTGFSESEIGEILSGYDALAADDALTDPDAIPDLDETQPPTVKRGQLWRLGEHHLFCGDSTQQADIDRLLQGLKADMVFTDPPYLMNYQGAMGKGGKKNQRHDVITNDNLSKAEGDQFLRAVCRSIHANCIGAWYISFYRLGIDRLYLAMADADLQWRNLIIWAKEHFNLSNSDYKSQYEPLVVGWHDDYAPIFYGWNDLHDFYGKKGEKDIWEVELPSLWRIARTKVNDLHPTIKPVELCERAILNSSKPGQRVLDLFGGSGSTLIAAERTHRKASLMELEPRYCDVIIRRWEDYTGRRAECVEVA